MTNDKKNVLERIGAISASIVSLVLISRRVNKERVQKRRADAAPSGTQSKGGALLRFFPGVTTETFEEALRPSSSTAPMVWRPSGTEWKKVSFGRDEPMYVPLRYH